VSPVRFFQQPVKLQGRFAHLFSPVRDEPLLAEIQAGVDAYWAQVEAGA
jgi:hypothetical protein